MNDKKIELKACPFCGERFAEIKRATAVSANKGFTSNVKYVICRNCGARTGAMPEYDVFNGILSMHTDEDAARIWNTRLEED